MVGLGDCLEKFFKKSDLPFSISPEFDFRRFFLYNIFLGMPDFDSSFTLFNMQDEHAQDNSLKGPGIINANAFSKVKNAFANAFAFQPVLA